MFRSSFNGYICVFRNTTMELCDARTVRCARNHIFEDARAYGARMDDFSETVHKQQTQLNSLYSLLIVTNPRG